MIRAISITALAACIFAATAFALSAPGVKANVKETSSSVTVTFMNNSSTSYKGYFINSTDSPKLTAASDKSCKVRESKAYKSGGKTHHDFYADCTGTVRAHKTLSVKLTSSGSGTVYVWVKLKNGYQAKVGQGG